MGAPDGLWSLKMGDGVSGCVLVEVWKMENNEDGKAEDD